MRSQARGGLPLGLDLEGVLSRTGKGVDLLLLPGDLLEVPQYDGTVRIIGAVGFQSRTRWLWAEAVGWGCPLPRRWPPPFRHSFAPRPAPRFSWRCCYEHQLSIDIVRGTLYVIIQTGRGLRD